MTFGIYIQFISIAWWILLRRKKKKLEKFKKIRKKILSEVMEADQVVFEQLHALLQRVGELKTQDGQDSLVKDLRGLGTDGELILRTFDFYQYIAGKIKFEASYSAEPQYEYSRLKEFFDDYVASKDSRIHALEEKNDALVVRMGLLQSLN